jgi:hypothetical protein
MTPCEKLGYKAGDEFVVTEDHWNAKKGEKLTLLDDDGTSLPYFEKHTKGGDERYFPHLNWVEKVTTGGEIITRTNGQPYATESSARQQLAAKGLQDTHEVARHGGGYALVPISRTSDPITLQPGDHVSTEGMTEDQYHAVARAFMAAGAKKGQRAPEWDQYPFLGWDARDRTLYAQADALPLCWTGRHLTIAQVLAATNANPQPEAQPEATATPSPITTLLAARKARDEAESAYQAAFEVVRNELPGYVLTEVGVDMAAGPDKTIIGGEYMTDPANWRAGDVVECVEPGCDLTVGKLYTVKKVLSSTDIRLVCDDNDDYPIRMPQKFRFHHRPA